MTATVSRGSVTVSIAVGAFKYSCSICLELRLNRPIVEAEEVCELLCEAFFSVSTQIPMRTTLRVDVERRWQRLSLGIDPEVRQLWESLCEMTCSWQDIPLEPSEMCFLVKQLVEAMEKEIGAVIGQDGAALCRYLIKVWILKSYFDPGCSQSFRAACPQQFPVCPADISLEVLPRGFLSETLTKNVQVACQLSCCLYDLDNRTEFISLVSWICENFALHLRVREVSGVSRESRPECMASGAGSSSTDLRPALTTSSDLPGSHNDYHIEKCLGSDYSRIMALSSEAAQGIPCWLLDHETKDKMEPCIVRSSP